MPPNHAMRRTLIALALAQSLAVPVAHSAVINIDGGCSLPDAIRSANTDSVVGGCEAGSGADIINIPQQTITLTNAAVDGEQYGESGLPLINSEISIQGNGATIERDSSADPFRILALDSTSNALLTMESITLTGGFAYNPGGGYGGAIYVGELTSLVLNSTTISGNTSDGYGGGVYSYRATRVEINDSNIHDNTAIQNGGGVSVSKDSLVEINRTTINTNTAGSAGGFSVFYSNGPVTLANSTIANNYLVDGNPSGEKGAGISLYRGSLSIVNSTISGNTASGSGSGMYVNASKVQLVNTTIANNQGGSTIVTTGNPTYVNTVTLINSVIAAPESQDACYILGSTETSVINGANSNWFTDNTCDGQADGDPLLAALANNGGPTLTHQPLMTSGLIDAADASACPATDQRGADRDAAGLFVPARTQNGNIAAISLDGECDIGAVEFLPI